MSILRSDLKDLTFMNIALELERLGTCNRLQVGAVITYHGRCISWGYNGTPPGEPHCDHSTDEPCTRATHAEANALAFAARQGISTAGGTVYVGVSPCANCARLLIAAGIRRVVFHTEYRDLEGVSILRRAGVPCSQLH